MEPDDFNAVEWAHLTKSERIAKCEKCAVVAEQMGQPHIAKQWRELAREIRNFRPDPQARVDLVDEVDSQNP